MDFVQLAEPGISRPIIIAAMQDMGNVGSIVINFINESLKTRPFRRSSAPDPTYVLDRGGYIDLPEESWEYRYADDLIVFGGGRGQPQNPGEMGQLCQDVVDVAARHSAKFIYTLGGYHTDRPCRGSPRTYVTTTSRDLMEQMRELGVPVTPQRSVITGFNGLILGFAKRNGIRGIGLYGELDNPKVPQYRAAVSIIRTLERLTYRRFGDTGRLEAMAQRTEKGFGN